MTHSLQTRHNKAVNTEHSITRQSAGTVHRSCPVTANVSSGRFPCRADFRCCLRLYRRDSGGVKFGSAAFRLSHSKVQSVLPLHFRQSWVNPPDVGEATLSQQLPDSHIQKLRQPFRFLSVLSKLLDSHWTMTQHNLLTKRCTGTVGLANF